MQMQVGGVRFDVEPGHAEYTELTRRRARRWNARERHGMPAQLEDLGRDAETMDLRGTVWVRTVDDLAALDVLRSEAGLLGFTGVPGAPQAERAATPLAVFRGGGDGNSGEYLGQWVVVRLSEIERHLRVDGVPTRIDFEMTLLEFVP